MIVGTPTIHVFIQGREGVAMEFQLGSLRANSCTLPKDKVLERNVREGEETWSVNVIVEGWQVYVHEELIFLLNPHMCVIFDSCL